MKRGESTLLMALAGGASVAEAAGRAGLSERTVYRRLDDAAFRDEVASARSAMIERAVARLADAAAEAVDTLVELLAPPTPASVRCSASRALLEAALRWRAAEELEARVAALETELATSRR